MKRDRSLLPVLMVILLFLTACASLGITGRNVPRISKEQLKTMLDDPDLVILDVRRERDWKSSHFKIKGAVYADPEHYDNWMADYPQSKMFVLYCT